MRNKGEVLRGLHAHGMGTEGWGVFTTGPDGVVMVARCTGPGAEQHARQIVAAVNVCARRLSVPASTAPLAAKMRMLRAEVCDLPQECRRALIQLLRGDEPAQTEEETHDV